MATGGAPATLDNAGAHQQAPTGVSTGVGGPCKGTRTGGYVTGVARGSEWFCQRQSNNWLRAYKRSVIADNGKSLVVPHPFAYLQDQGIGWSKAVKTVVLCARLRAWSRGMRRQQW